MEIEKVIQQKQSFRNEFHKAVVNMLYTSGWLTRELTSLLKQYGIAMQQYNVLRILRGSYPDPLSTCEIRDRMIDKMSDSSRIVERLRRKGLVKKCVSSNDRRRVEVLISEGGMALLEEIDKNEVSFDSLLNRLTEEEAKALNSLLNKMRPDLQMES